MQFLLGLYAGGLAIILCLLFIEAVEEDGANTVLDVYREWRPILYSTARRRIAVLAVFILYPALFLGCVCLCTFQIIKKKVQEKRKKAVIA
jgi:hypothetical protein